MVRVLQCLNAVCWSSFHLHVHTFSDLNDGQRHVKPLIERCFVKDFFSSHCLKGMESCEKVNTAYYTAWSRKIIVIDFLVSPRCCFILPHLLASFPSLLPFIHLCLPPFCTLCWPLPYYLFFISSCLSFHVIFSPTYYHPSPPLPHPPSLSLPIHPSLPPRWTGRSDLYLSGMDESQVWFKCPNYSPELWCPALGYVAPSLWLCYESWHGRTEPFTEAGVRARSHERFSPCTGLWKADGWCWKLTTWTHSDSLWSMPVVPLVLYSTDIKVRINWSILAGSGMQWTMSQYRELMCMGSHTA